MTCRVGSVRLRVHPLLPVLWGFAFLTGAGKTFFPMLLALGLHEAGHILAVRMMCVPVGEIELTPLGGVLILDDLEALPPQRHFWVALGGPLFSFLGCLLSVLIYRAHTASMPFLSPFFRANLTLFLVNLLPALPLDGGQLARDVLQKWFSFARLTRLLTIIAFAIGIFLCGCTFFFAFQGQMILAPAFAGLYLLYAAVLEKRQGTAKYVTSLIARRQKLENHETLPVEWLAVSADAAAGNVLRRLSPGKYHVIYVLSEDGMKKEGILDEQDFCEALLDSGNLPLRAILRKKEARPEQPGSDALPSLRLVKNEEHA